MKTRKKTIRCQAVHCKNSRWKRDSLEVIAEEPFLIRIDEEPYSVVMRTPGEELYHAAGFCLAEGIIDSADDFKSIDYDEHSDANVIDVRLTAERREKIPHILRRRSFVSQTSCGICGKELIEDLYQQLTPLPDGPVIELDGIYKCIQLFSEKQKYYQTTKGSHAAMILDDRLTEVSIAEDVGRHNALDKAIGQALIDGLLPNAGILILSSRNSHELVQKAARARLRIIISHSRPTALAIEMGKDLNMTIGFPDEDRGLVIVSGESRLTKEAT